MGANQSLEQLQDGTHSVLTPETQAYLQTIYPNRSFTPTPPLAPLTFLNQGNAFPPAAFPDTGVGVMQIPTHTPQNWQNYPSPAATPNNVAAVHNLNHLAGRAHQQQLPQQQQLQQHQHQQQQLQQHQHQQQQQHKYQQQQHQQHPPNNQWQSHQQEVVGQQSSNHTTHGLLDLAQLSTFGGSGGGGGVGIGGGHSSSTVMNYGNNDADHAKGAARSGKKRKRKEPLRKPSADRLEEYRWRKYGSKQIKGGPNFPGCSRGYYKCAIAGCPARKIIEDAVNQSTGLLVSSTMIKGEHVHSDKNVKTKTETLLESPTSAAAPAGTAAAAAAEAEAEAAAAAAAALSFAASRSSSSSFTKVTPSTTTTTVTTTATTKQRDDITAHVAGSIEVSTKVQLHRLALARADQTAATATRLMLRIRMANPLHALDDGLRWRKYGQKLVKGLPYPRNYYRCAVQGCQAKKLVEQVEPECSVATYDYFHTHPISEAIKKRRT